MALIGATWSYLKYTELSTAGCPYTKELLQIYATQRSTMLDSIDVALIEEALKLASMGAVRQHCMVSSQ